MKKIHSCKLEGESSLRNTLNDEQKADIGFKDGDDVIEHCDVMAQVFEICRQQILTAMAPLTAFCRQVIRKVASAGGMPPSAPFFSASVMMRDRVVALLVFGRCSIYHIDELQSDEEFQNRVRTNQRDLLYLEWIQVFDTAARYVLAEDCGDVDVGANEVDVVVRRRSSSEQFIYTQGEPLQ